MTNTIKNVAVHDLNRTGTAFTVTLGTKQLTVTPTVQRVIDDLYDLYSKRTSKSHGKFSEKKDDYPTEGHLKEYVDGDAKDFSALTTKLMTTLQVQAAKRTLATGGHVLFSHFVRDARDYLLVAIVTDKLGAALTSDLDMNDVKHLDMDGFRFAGRINITGWQNKEERYIGFIKGKGDVAEYFKEFLGCDTTTPDRKDTVDLVSALKMFADSQKMSTEDREDFLYRAKIICERAARNKEELEFETLANELVPKDPKVLKNALADPNLQLNDGFVPNLRALRSLVRFKAKTQLWSLEFDREALTAGNIKYDASSRKLTISDLPADLVSELNRELSPDGKS